MRFDKDLWNTNSREYGATDVTEQQVEHVTAPVRVFLSYWLELLQDDRSPETRALRSLAIPDQISELLRALLLTEQRDSPNYRVRTALSRLQRQIHAITCPFVGRDELERLCNDASVWLRLMDEGDQKARRKLEKEIRSDYAIPQNASVAQALSQQIRFAALGALSQIRGQPEYRDALSDFLRRRLADPNATAAEFFDDCAGAMRELLALVLDRGNSRESLAELPVKYLRGDNVSLSGKAMDERSALLFGAFRGPAQEYVVYLPMGDVHLDVQGEIFPPGVSILDVAGWHASRAIFADTPLQESLPAESSAFRVEVGTYLTSGVVLCESRPLDVFAARDVAVRAAQACLDAVFLYREHRIHLDKPCAVVATTPREGASASSYECVLRQRHESGARTRIALDFLRPVPAMWADALHWYRLGNVTNKDESGIVNLWTSAELLAANCHGTHGTAIDRVRSSVGTVAALFLFAEHQEYLASAARHYALQYERESVLNAPVPDADRTASLEWWLALCSSHDELQLSDAVFDMFPLLAVEALVVKRRLEGGDQRGWYDEHQVAIHDDLSWIYGCRNDVVHDGQIMVPGAAIARAIAAECVGTTLQATLMMRARGSTSSLNECFALASAKERTLRWHLEHGRIFDALMTPYR